MPYRGELPRVSDQEDVSTRATRAKERRRQAGVDHAGFVDDDELERQRVGFVVLERPAATLGRGRDLEQ